MRPQKRHARCAVSPQQQPAPQLAAAEPPAPADEDAPIPALSLAPALHRAPPDLLRHLATLLPPNDVALGLRLVDKRVAGILCDKQHTTIHPRQPIAAAELERAWGGKGGVLRLRRLTPRQRRHVRFAAAANGAVGVLEVLELHDWLDVEEERVVYQPFSAAARHGQLAVCSWLCSKGNLPWVVVYEGVCDAAARGHAAVVDVLLSYGADEETVAAGAVEAARGGHMQLMDSLRQHLQQRCPEDYMLSAGELLPAAAYGCDLATLQRLHEDLTSHEASGQKTAQKALCEAVKSPTPDWQLKVSWLESKGCARNASAITAALEVPGGVDRAEWLRQRGYPFMDGAAVAHALVDGNMAALQYSLDHGLGPLAAYGPSACQYGLFCAAGAGHLAALQLAHAGGYPFELGAGKEAAVEAAKHGHPHVVAWLVEVLGREVLSAKLMTAAIRRDASCSTEQLERLAALGCPADASTLAAAVASGKEEVVAWLEARDCPFDATTFVAAAQAGDVGMVRRLARRGCPMHGAYPDPYASAVAAKDVRMLTCLQRLGCPLRDDTFVRAMDAATSAAGDDAGDEVEAFAPALAAREPALLHLRHLGCPLPPRFSVDGCWLTQRQQGYLPVWVNHMRARLKAPRC